MPGDLNYLEISRGALERNAKAFAEYVKVPVIGVLKCDGYGVSLDAAAKAWETAGVTMFGVSEPREAIELRRLGYGQEILLLAPHADETIARLLKKENVVQTVASAEQARQFSEWFADDPVRVHFAVDTGMGRFGFRYNDTKGVIAAYELPGLMVEGICSHFAAAFEAEEGMVTTRQLNRFNVLTEWLGNRGVETGMRHIANSVAALRFPGTRLDAVRAGSALVGFLPCEVPIALEEAAVYKAQVVAIKELKRGDTSGYGAIFKAKRRIRAAVVAIGEESGFGRVAVPDSFRFRDKAANAIRALRAPASPLSVRFKGTDLPLLGRVGTQYTLFDTVGTDIGPGDVVSARPHLLAPQTSRVFVK